jgi:hypothetical protein
MPPILHRSEWRESQRGAETVLDEDAVARRERTRRLVRGDQHLGEHRPRPVVDTRHQLLDLARIVDPGQVVGIAGNLDQMGPMSGPTQP